MRDRSELNTHTYAHSPYMCGLWPLRTEDWSTDTATFKVGVRVTPRIPWPTHNSCYTPGHKCPSAVSVVGEFDSSVFEAAFHICLTFTASGCSLPYHFNIRCKCILVDIYSDTLLFLCFKICF